MNELTQNEKNQVTAVALDSALAYLITSKPEERSELARRYAVTITEMEKVYAYFMQYTMEEGNK